MGFQNVLVECLFRQFDKVINDEPRRTEARCRSLRACGKVARMIPLQCPAVRSAVAVFDASFRKDIAVNYNVRVCLLLADAVAHALGERRGKVFVVAAGHYFHGIIAAEQPFREQSGGTAFSVPRWLAYDHHFFIALRKALQLIAQAHQMRAVRLIEVSGTQPAVIPKAAPCQFDARMHCNFLSIHPQQASAVPPLSTLQMDFLLSTRRCAPLYQQNRLRPGREARMLLGGP